MVRLIFYRTVFFILIEYLILSCMKIKKLNILNLRNHKFTELEFSNSLNIFYGLNGSGKTTILEAISIASFSKSFLPTQDSALINYNEKQYSISVKAINDYGIPYIISIKYDKINKKEINSNAGDKITPKDIIGEIPCIILSPDYKKITFGTPADRRDFLDKLLSQSSKKYLEDLMTYRKSLRQRNTQLQKTKIHQDFDENLFNSWTEILIQTGAAIIKKRIDFINDFIPYFEKLYSFVSDEKEKVTLEYLPHGIPKIKPLHELSEKDIQTYLHNFSLEILPDEKRRGLTLFGPQRDELKIKINGGLAKDSASQGQHKTLLICIKFAEFEYLKNMKNETPLALLDDIFSELDKKRTDKVLALLEKNSAQTFITVTDFELLKPLIPDTINYKIFQLSDGVIVKES